MKGTGITAIGLMLGLICLGLAAPRQAQAVSFAFGDWSQQFPSEYEVPSDAPHGPDGYPGDTVALEGASGSFALVDGAWYEDVQFSTTHWAIDYTWGGDEDYVEAHNWNAPWPELNFDFVTELDLSLGGTYVGTMTQAGHLRSEWENDHLSFDAGPTSAFVYDGFVVRFTPYAVAEISGSDFSDGPPWNQPDITMKGRVDVEAIPEPTTLMTGALLLGMLGAAKLRSLRKRPKA